MNTTTIGLRKLFVTAGVIFVVLSTWIVPVIARAAELASEAKVQTVQLLPPNVGNTCPSLSAPIFKSYVYNNEVNSFDVTISDATYVAIAGSVGETSIPFNYITRFVDASGVLHLHVDTPAVAVRGTLPITLTLLSVRPDRTVCAATVSATLGGGTITGGVPSGSTGNGSIYVPPVAEKPRVDVPGIDNSKDTTDDKTVVGGSGLQSALAKACETTNGTTRLWTVLLAIYLLVVAATILAQPTTRPSERSSLLIGAAIVIPLIVLFVVWGMAPDCRIGIWAPLAALAIAAAGFALGFRHSGQFSKTFAPPQMPKSPPPPPSTKPLITPPPKSPPPPPPAQKNEKDK
jgi:hypothetical protein